MRNLSNLKDQDLEARIFLHRVIWVLVFVGLLATALIIRLYQLQVIEYDKYTTKSTNNYLRIEPDPPVRGLIYDRNKNLLAGNEPTFNLEITPEKVNCPAKTKRSTCIRSLLKRLAGLINIEESDLGKFWKKYRISIRYKQEFQSIPIRHSLKPDEVAVIAAESHGLPGVDIVAKLKRRYPYANSLAHVVGYVRHRDKKIDKELEKKNQKANYAGTTHVGIRGIEKSYEHLLHGTVGKQQTERNAFGRVIRRKSIKPSKPGKNIYLTIDKDLQELAEAGLKNKNGAVVAIDPNNGEVLVLVSKPGYDPNLFVDGISRKNYRELQRNEKKPLNIRALMGTYNPGSTIKPFYGLAGIHYRVVKPNTAISCIGYFTLPGIKHRWRDWKKGGHGRVNLNASIMRSCDVYYYSLAVKLGIDRITEFLSMFGWGEKTGIDMPQERVGVLPSREWKKRRFRGPKKRPKGISDREWARRKAMIRIRQRWYTGDTVSIGIGQGYVTVTPMQLAMATTIMANKGKIVIPHLLRAVNPAGTRDFYYVSPEREDPRLKEHKINKTLVKRARERQKWFSRIKPEHWAEVHKGMIDVIHGWGGTARRLAKLTENKYQIAGKTGTAQVIGMSQSKYLKDKDLPEKYKDNALFIAFAPAKNPKIAIAVVVERGGHGGSAAAPIAGALIKAYLDKLERQKALTGDTTEPGAAASRDKQGKDKTKTPPQTRQAGTPGLLKKNTSLKKAVPAKKTTTPVRQPATARPKRRPDAGRKKPARKARRPAPVIEKSLNAKPKRRKVRRRPAAPRLKKPKTRRKKPAAPPAPAPGEPDTGRL